MKIQPAQSTLNPRLRVHAATTPEALAFKLYFAAAVVLGCFHLEAQIVFSIDSLPSQSGWYCRAYVNTTDVDVSTRLGQPGGPQRWDFSQPASTNEIVKRLDIIPASQSGSVADFPEATYAEQVTTEGSSVRSWSYYRIVPNQGRAYYGFYDSAANPAKPLTVFKAPTIDLPQPIRFGQTWNRTVDWDDVIDTGVFQLQVAVHFSAQAHVDAYGTLVLPRIGEFAALRVNELHTYEMTDQTLGLPLDNQYVRNYYWLVPGLGKALDLLSGVQTNPPPDDFTQAKSCLRVFEASSIPSPQPVQALGIRLQAGQAVLSWRPETNATSYRVELRRDFSTNSAWQLLAQPATNSWSETLNMNEAQRFFRVLSVP